MFFNSLNFICFFAVVLLILLLEKLFTKSVPLRNVTLLIASYIFYGWFNVDFLLLLLYVTSVNYIGGELLQKTSRRRTVVGWCVVLSLLPLFFFKYALFLLKSFRQLLELDFDLAVMDGIILPVGISFFTFQALSYTIDMYRRKISNRYSFIDFALFVPFFPTVLSGPIEKARELLPQLKIYHRIDASCLIQGASIFIWGLFKKVVVADRLAYYVDWVYGTSGYRNGTTLLVAAVFYSIQIYCDFSGYSDMALGVGKALGFDLTKNFRQPYFSKTIKEFWRKWHIALTTWFTEYIYFSLGGNRVKYKARWIFNISMVFVLSGIWHGAAWNFLIWGSMHAVFYLIEYYFGLQKKEVKWNWFTSLLSGIVVFALVTLAWIFFRVPTFEEATYIVAKIFTDAGTRMSMGASTFTFVGTVAMLVIFLGYEMLVRNGLISFDVKGFEKKLIWTFASCIPLLLLLALFGKTSDSFVYFQF